MAWPEFCFLSLKIPLFYVSELKFPLIPGAPQGAPNSRFSCWAVKKFSFLKPKNCFRGGTLGLLGASFFIIKTLPIYKNTFHKQYCFSERDQKKFFKIQNPQPNFSNRFLEITLGGNPKKKCPQP